ncbi:6-phospho-beta-glucosidase [candidate division KSB1 bacterium]|nr:6-phospho-beta-glucosidase [candidate division KSB1 bacterium]
MKICIVGAGSTYTPELIQGFITISKQVRIDKIIALDIPASEEKFHIVADFAQRMLHQAGASINLKTTMDAEQAFAGADFIIFQFRAGLMEGRIRDEKIPLEFGLIGQETTGIGGMACALRGLPMIESYVDLARRVSNNAWIINFTNPSGLLTEFMVNDLDYTKCIGLCNVPIEFVLEAAKHFNCERDEVFLKYYGLNHLSWVEKIVIRGKDRTEEMWDRFKLNMKNIPATDYEPDFLQKLRLLPNPYLRYFYMTDKMLESEYADRDGKGTRGQVILCIEDKLLQLYKNKQRHKIPEELNQRGGYMYSTVATELIRDLVLDSGKVHIINKRNEGAVSDLPDDYVLEMPVAIQQDVQKSLPLGPSHKATTGLIHTIKNFERLTIEGYQKRDENLIKQAMLIHPLGPTESRLEPLWSRLKEENRDYFVEFA